MYGSVGSEEPSNKKMRGQQLINFPHMPKAAAHAGIGLMIGVGLMLLKAVGANKK
jgi:hypothetical protein